MSIRISDERLAEIEAKWHRDGLSESGFDWNLYGYELLKALKWERKLIVLKNEHLDELITDLEAMKPPCALTVAPAHMDQVTDKIETCKPTKSVMKKWW